MKDVRLSLRLLFESDRLRIFYTTIRLDPYHPGDVEAWREVVGAMGDRDVLIWGMYWFSDEAYFREAAVWYDSVPFPRDRVWVLGNTEAEVAAARRAGFPALWVNNNAWLDESLFKPQPVEKQHRAILISQDVPYKRIHLAAEVDDLVLVLSQRFPSAPLVDRSRLSTAHVVGKLSSSEVVSWICRCRAGLILSEEEGACYASSEYLLCGIPVVSTWSRGGRDVFYTDENSLVVEPDAASVAEGVARWMNRSPDPWRLHHHHVALSQGFRRRFVDDVLSVMFRRGNVDACAQEVFARVYRHKMVDYVDVPTALALVGG